MDLKSRRISGFEFRLIDIIQTDPNRSNVRKLNKAESQLSEGSNVEYMQLDSPNKKRKKLLKKYWPPNFPRLVKK